MGLNVSDIFVTHTARGLARYAIELSHDGLNRFQVVRGDDPYLVKQKATALASQWTDAWARIEARAKAGVHLQNRQEAAEQATAGAQAAQAELGGLLAATLSVNDAIDWNSLKDRSTFPQKRPAAPQASPPPIPTTIPVEPLSSSPDYAFRPGILDKLFKKRAARRAAEAASRLEAAHAEWVRDRAVAEAIDRKAFAAYEAGLKEANRVHSEALARWSAAKTAFEEARVEQNKGIDEKCAQYMRKESEAVVDMCDMVLGRSRYPDCFPRTWSLDYVADSRMVVIDYQLPAPSDLPTLASVKYVKSRDAMEEKHLSEAEKNRTYDGVLYQVALRTIHEMFEADVAQAIDVVTFNGIVEAVDPSTGHNSRACVLSVQAGREEFLAINLAAVDAKTCFRKLKGVGSSKLHNLAPVPPLVQLEREDPRYVAGYAVAESLDQGSNLAAMDWEDFEHLIRELFEREFQQHGAEVRVTRGSRDGGVDAVVLDPNPIRGGKIVIQAKRYTNTVGVAAVRELYGTLMNEGATKGILVTTADYGPDAYEFAKGKPLTLLSGANLLHMLQSHGVRARIDLAEARKQAGRTDPRSVAITNPAARKCPYPHHATRGRRKWKSCSR